MSDVSEDWLEQTQIAHHADLQLSYEILHTSHTFGLNFHSDLMVARDFM